MQIFISWSGKTGESVANILYEWLPDVIQTVTPIISNRTEAGTDWLSNINKGLRENGEGIIVVTPDSQSSTWLNYEAGVMAGQSDSRVRPVTFQMRPADVELPLGTLQAVELTNETTMLQLVQGIGERERPPIATVRVERAFRQNWEALQSKLSAIAAAYVEPSEPRRSSEDMLEETLEGIRLLVRGQSDERERNERLEDIARRGEAASLSRHENSRKSRLNDEISYFSNSSTRVVTHPPEGYYASSSEMTNQFINKRVWSPLSGLGKIHKIREDGVLWVNWDSGEMSVQRSEDLFFEPE